MNERNCPHCPSRVPLVSSALADRIARRIDPAQVKEVVRVCIDWLVEKTPGVTIYDGIRGRAYTPQEKAHIALDQNAVASTPCPFNLAGIGCGLEGYCSIHEYAAEQRQGPYGFLPTLLLRGLDKRALEYLVDTRQVADAKIAAATMRDDFPVVDPATPYLVGSKTKGLAILTPEDSREVSHAHDRISEGLLTG